ncbi:MAG: O-antigen ligase family protein, partial [Candidatus Aureabacteria bacterium]|nr:O-antigen ligase family protein [Candidatus Auribacterota bacterium]
MECALARTIRIGIVVILILVPLIYSSQTQNSFAVPKKAFFQLAVAALLTLFALRIIVAPSCPQYPKDVEQSTPAIVEEQHGGDKQAIGLKLLYEGSIRESSTLQEMATWRWSILGTFGNANHMASYLALSCPLLFVAARGARGPARALASLGLAAVLSCLALIGARGSWCAAAAGLSLPLIYGASQGRGVNLRRAAAVLLICGAVIALVAILRPKVTHDLLDRLSIASLRNPTGSTQFRLLTWRVSLDMIASRPLAGSGQGTFKLLFLPALADHMRGRD